MRRRFWLLLAVLALAWGRGQDRASAQGTATPTFTASPTVTRTKQPPSATNTATNTATFTATSTNTATFTRTATATFTKTATPTFTRTYTPTLTYTNTPTPTSTYTFTPTPTYTNTPTPTYTFTPSNTPTPTATFTPTPSSVLRVPDLLVLGVKSAPKLAKLVDLTGRNGRQLSPNLEIILEGNTGDTLRILRAQTGDVLGASVDPYAGRAVFSADGHLIAIATTKNIEIHDGSAGRLLSTIVLRNPDAGAPYFNFSGDARYLVVREKTVAIWDVRTRPVLTIEIGAGYSDLFGGLIAISPEGDAVATTENSGRSIYLWRKEALAVSGKYRARLDGHTGAITGLGFSPDNNTLVSASEDGTLRLWDVLRRAEIAQLRGHTGQILSLDISADGTLAATSGNDGTVRAWDLQKRALLVTLSGDSKAPGSVQFAASGKILYARDGNTIRVWGTAGTPGVAGNLCSVTARRDAILRDQPDMKAINIGKLAADTTQDADAMTLSKDGDTWYRLVGGGWTRSVLLSVPDECANLPQVKP